MKTNLEGSVIEKNSSILEQSLTDAITDFRKEYILATAQNTQKFDIYSMSRKLNYDRSELSKFVNEKNVKPKILQMQKNYSPKDYFQTNKEYSNPITKEVVSESISTNNFDIKLATNRFKKKYITYVVKEYGFEKASELLDVSSRTLKNHFSNNTDLSAMVN